MVIRQELYQSHSWLTKVRIKLLVFFFFSFSVVLEAQKIEVDFITDTIQEILNQDLVRQEADYDLIEEKKILVIESPFFLELNCLFDRVEEVTEIDFLDLLYYYNFLHNKESVIISAVSGDKSVYFSYDPSQKKLVKKGEMRGYSPVRRISEQLLSLPGELTSNLIIHTTFSSKRKAMKIIVDNSASHVKYSVVGQIIDDLIAKM